MTDTTDIIRHAKELISLREEISRGAWEVVNPPVIAEEDGPAAIKIDLGLGWFLGARKILNPIDAVAFSRIHDMIATLEELVNELEERNRWAQSMCRAYCADLESRGKHMSNCPVDDWGLKRPTDVKR